MVRMGRATQEHAEPVRDILRTHAPIRGTPVGLTLRRQARELIETIPAIELPTAIAFMEFLKQRSAEAMAKSHRDADAHDIALDNDPKA